MRVLNKSSAGFLINALRVFQKSITGFLSFNSGKGKTMDEFPRYEVVFHDGKRTLLTRSEMLTVFEHLLDGRSGDEWDNIAHILDGNDYEYHRGYRAIVGDGNA